ncbi:MAG: glycoside hydrolase family 3 C-terminal domain-containing protein [Oscillospiraceae bacterium]|nr:glycoside hydrolase family 3 C-terminal domain-containing protein [Oscillospiraceae bacterium]
MLKINIDDVKTVIGLMRGHLIALAICLALAIVVTIAVMKLPKAARKLARGNAWLAFVLAVVIIVNLILTGPVYSIVNLALGDNGDISEKSIETATDLCTQIAEEGIILLKNDGVLPLKNTKVNTFGWAVTNPVYGGTGSGSLSGAYPTVTLLEGLTNAGITYNTDITDFYTGWRDTRPTMGMYGQDWTIPEPTQEEYQAAGIYESALGFSDTALIVISRCGGEGADLPMTYDGEDTFVDDGLWGSYGIRYSEYADDLDESKHYLELTNREIEMVEAVTEKFQNVVVVINSANAMELGWVNEYPSIKGVLYCPGTGQSGFNALGNILTGAVNPSGKTVDTFVADLTTTPTWNNFGANYYTNMEDVAPEVWGEIVYPSYVCYVEGIYVGYKFYETAAAEGLIDYDKTVVYPFGYGLSYTSFTQEMGDITEKDGVLSVDVTVTNTGSVAGKDVVEVYFNPPYTNGGIEKATANLVAFDKTKELAPGKSETLTLSWKLEDMASYDTYGHGCYVLEKGDYVVSINSDSHTVIDSRTYTVGSDVVYSDGRSTDLTPASNQFGFAENTEQITYLSRKDGFANYEEATAPQTFTEMSEEHKAGYYTWVNYDPAEFNSPDDVMPTTGAKNGIQLVDMRGVDYDDPKWDSFLDQLTVSEMVNLISVGGYQSVAINSIGKTQQIDCDGPASINNNFTGKGSIGFPAGVMIAATWNEDLAREFGSSIGQMADEMNVSGWYAPAMNTHRSAFAGRNFEYYSEDGFLAGKMAANAVAGAREHGVYSFIKHFALNDQETNRDYLLSTWSNEQAIREIYLKPFEMAVKEGGAQAVMSSYNYIGNEYAGACNALLNNVLRDEWGFRGAVLTDYFAGIGYQDADIQIRNGGDFCLNPMESETSVLTDQSSATSILAARQACKNILYTTCNSRAYSADVLNPGLPTWQIIMYVIDAVVVALLALWEVKLIKNFKKARKETVVETVPAEEE